MMLCLNVRNLTQHTAQVLVQAMVTPPCRDFCKGLLTGVRMCGQAASDRPEFVGCLVYKTEVGPHPTAEGALVADRIGVYSFMLAYRVPATPASSYLNNLVGPHAHLICCVPNLSSVRLFCQTIF